MQSDLEHGQDRGVSKVKPIRNPNTIAKSLAIGDPADGFFRLARLIPRLGGWSVFM